jgi:GntR family transcriptional regulator, rspAB operon transcriptional repressor
MAPPQRLNRSEHAYEYLLAEILRGRWQPGDTLSTYALSEELEISRTPVLDALKRLEAEGLVEIIPQVGCRVVRPSPKAIEELFAIRGALEGLAAAAAAKVMGDDDLDLLDELLRRMDTATSRHDESAFDELNYEFHMHIVRCSAMPRLLQTALGVWSLLRYQLARIPIPMEQVDESTPEHRKIADALRRRDASEARDLVEQHAHRCADLFTAELTCAATERSTRVP